MKVICNHVAASCDERCAHKKPHYPIKDTYYPKEGSKTAIGGLVFTDGLCSEYDSPCEMKGGHPEGTCLCVPCEDQRHKTIPALPGIGE